jgi:uncharacterized membrane protein YeaQ/YmgE (transglycosylase-associated protein family)
MNLFLWAAMGALIGWSAGFSKSTQGRQRLLVETGFAAAGGLLGGFLVSPLDRWLSFEVHWPGLAAAAIGAAGMLVIGSLRWRQASRVE